MVNDDSDRIFVLERERQCTSVASKSAGNISFAKGAMNSTISADMSEVLKRCMLECWREDEREKSGKERRKNICE